MLAWNYHWMLIAAGIVLLAIAGYFRFKKFLRRLAKEVGDSGATWRAYFRGQGTVLSLSLLAGIALSWGSWAYSGYAPGAAEELGGSLVEYRDLDPSEHPVYEEIDAKAYRHVTIFTRTSAPENAEATVTVFDDQDGKTKGEIQHLHSPAGAWSRWRHENANRNLSVVIESATSASTPKASKVDLLIYLSTQ
jgi:hypothetical protein